MGAMRVFTCKLSNFCYGLFCLVTSIFLFSCATSGSYNPVENIEDYNILGQMKTTFIESTSLGMGIINDHVIKRGYLKLLDDSKEMYGEDVDIVNIKVSLLKKLNMGGVLCEWDAFGTVIQKYNNNVTSAGDEKGFSFSVGYINKIAYRNVFSTRVKASGVDITDYVNIAEENTLFAPGVSLFGRYFRNLNDGLFLKLNIFFPQELSTNFNIATSGYGINVKNESSWDTAIMYDLGFGATYRFFPSRKAHLLMDFGADSGLFLYSIGDIKEAVFFIGPTFDLTGQFMLTEHLYIEPGLNVSFLFGFGGRQAPDLNISQISLIGNVAPFVLFGYNF
jgi:hypothetical protein